MKRGERYPIRVLHVDDEPDFADLTGTYLERHLADVEVLTATRASEALELLDETIDCVVSDHDMPGKNGLEFLRDVRERDGDLPFILFTGKGSEEIASEAISAGVTEYLEKGRGTDQYEVLAHRIERAVAERRAQAALEESERMFSTLVENLPGMVYRCRIEEGWPMVYVSPGCEDLTGYSAEAVERSEVSWGGEIIHPDDRERVWGPVEQAIADRGPFEIEYRIQTADGDEKWVWERGSAVYEDGDATYLEGFITDITPYRERAAELRDQREFTEAALNALEDAFYVVDHETGEFIRWNDRLPEFTGYSAAELAEMTVFDLVPEEDVAAIIEAGELAREGQSEFLEVTTVTKDGERIPVEVRGAPLYDGDGELLGIGSIARDVSEGKEREQRLAEFASVVSHDLRNPLHVIEGHVELAREADDHGEHLERIADAADRMDELIEDLLSLAREGRMIEATEPVALVDVAETAWETVARASASLEIREDGTVEADRDRLREMLENLFRNAVEHASTDTQSLTLEEAVDGAGTAGDGEGGPRVRIRVGLTDTGFFVADDGPGIPEAEREAVFQHGYSTRENGTGYGLSIVRRLAEAHGWSVLVTEGEWGGARFEFET